MERVCIGESSVERYTYLIYIWRVCVWLVWLNIILLTLPRARGSNAATLISSTCTGQNACYPGGTRYQDSVYQVPPLDNHRPVLFEKPVDALVYRYLYYDRNISVWMQEYQYLVPPGKGFAQIFVVVTWSFSYSIAYYILECLSCTYNYYDTGISLPVP